MAGRSGVAHSVSLSGIPNYGLGGVLQGDEHPASTVQFGLRLLYYFLYSLGYNSLL